MRQLTNVPEVAHKAGRPRRGTGAARTTALLDAATRVFLSEGYALASMDKVATEAGVSTRTIYGRHKNKADLFGAVISRLVDRMSTVLATADLERLEPRAALRVIARTLTQRVREPDSAALFRIVCTEAHRFPELAEKMRDSDKRCVDHALAAYFRCQVTRGALRFRDADKAATLFLKMIFSEIHECLLLHSQAAMAQLDCDSHSEDVIEIFLHGAVPRDPTL